MAAKKKKSKQNKKKGTGKQEVWDRPNPKANSKKLTPAEKGAATKHAHAQGRSKPALVDSLAAQKQSRKGKKAKKG